MLINEILLIGKCVVVLSFCFVTLGQLLVFLSSHTHLKYSSNRLEDRNHGNALIPVLINLCLLCLFGLQHTLQARQSVKDYLQSRGYDVIERLLYNCGSCVALQVLMYLWQPIPDWTVWEIVTSKHVLLWWFFSIVHGIAWMAIYSGCFIMDVTELLGVKQVYHHLKGWPKPMNLKSEGLRRFYSHMRHPSFSALAVILFIHPVMHLDRLLLAYTCTIFMLLHFKVDEIDYTYQRRMLQRKAQELNMNN